jgi:CotH kinase protein
MNAVLDNTQLSQQKAQFFAEDMYMVHITGFPRERLVLQTPVKSSGNPRFELWRTDPRDGRHIPPPSGEGVLFGTSRFSIMNSGNRTLYAPKASWKFNFETADDDSALVGMHRLNLKAMYNDPSQMREALVWGLFNRIGVPAPRHTFANLAFDAEFSPDTVAARILPDSETGLLARVRQAAYLESDTPHGAPFTGRQFTNDEVYLAGCKQNEIRHDKAKIDGIFYVRMRYDSARKRLQELRKTIPRGEDAAAFPITMEPLPGGT